MDISILRLEHQETADFVISLLESLLCQSLPALGSVNGLSRLHSDIKITALDRKLESRAFIFDKMKSNLERTSIWQYKEWINKNSHLRKPFLLQVPNDALTD